MTQVNEKEENSRTNKYVIYLIVIIIFVAILDSYSTNFIMVIPSRIEMEFLYPMGYTGNEADSIYSFLVAIASLGMYFCFIFQWISDRIGRKLLLIISVLGMGLASLLLSFSSNIIEYTFFLFVLYIFFNADIQMIYISEESPPEKRARLYNLIMMGSVAGTLSVPVFRSIFITESSPVGSWRGMVYFPFILCVPLAIIIILTVKETSKFEEIKRKSLTENNSIKSENLRAKLEKIFTKDRRAQYLIILFFSFISGVNYIFIVLGEAFLSSIPTLNEGDINIVVMVMALSIFFGYLVTGIIADKFGRKKLMYIYAVLVPFSRLILFLGSLLPTRETALLIILIGAGMSNISLIGFYILTSTINLEILPTETRGTGTGLKSLILHIGTTLGLVLSGIITVYAGLGITFLIASLPLIITIPLIYVYIKETKGLDLSQIK